MRVIHRCPLQVNQEETMITPCNYIHPANYPEEALVNGLKVFRQVQHRDYHTTINIDDLYRIEPSPDIKKVIPINIYMPYRDNGTDYHVELFERKADAYRKRLVEYYEYMKHPYFTHPRIKMDGDCMIYTTQVNGWGTDAWTEVMMTLPGFSPEFTIHTAINRNQLSLIIVHSALAEHVVLTYTFDYLLQTYPFAEFQRSVIEHLDKMMEFIAHTFSSGQRLTFKQINHELYMRFHVKGLYLRLFDLKYIDLLKEQTKYLDLDTFVSVAMEFYQQVDQQTKLKLSGIELEDRHEFIYLFDEEKPVEKLLQVSIYDDELNKEKLRQSLMTILRREYSLFVCPFKPQTDTLKTWLYERFPYFMSLLNQTKNPLLQVQTDYRKIIFTIPLEGMQVKLMLSRQRLIDNHLDLTHLNTEGVIFRYAE